MASFALFNFEFEPIQNKLRQALTAGLSLCALTSNNGITTRQ